MTQLCIYNTFYEQHIKGVTHKDRGGLLGHVSGHESAETVYIKVINFITIVIRLQKLQ